MEATWGGWDEDRHDRQFSESMNRGRISIIEVDGAPVGMIQLFEENDVVEVGEIQIDPRHQNRGIGTSMLLDVISRASGRGRDVIRHVSGKRRALQANLGGGDLTIQRMDNVGIVVDDLAAAIAYFVELGLELKGETQVEGRWADRVTGLDGVRVDVAMVRTPDGHGRLELMKFHRPTAASAEP